MTGVQTDLFSMQDLKYREFNSKLIPTVEPELVIGVRTPELRKYAKKIAKTSEAAEFIKTLPHKYFEENNLHAFILETIRDYETAMYETERFLPYIDNWATCDMFAPGVFKSNTDRLLEKIRIWVKSEHTYTIRYGIGLLMRFYLDEKFKPELLDIAASVRSQKYYVNMMIAWYFATALAKQYDAALPYITENRLDAWVHNRTIQKAAESFRIPDETKKYLKTLKIKTK